MDEGLAPGLRDRVAVVTGANNPYGIGAEVAKALEGYTRSAALELGRFGITEDVADVVVFLASHQARWATGHKKSTRRRKLRMSTLGSGVKS